MKKLLHIIATPRGNESRTLQLASAVIEKFKKAHPDAEIDELNLFTETLPEMNAEQVAAKYSPSGGSDILEPHHEIGRQIQRFLSADLYLITCPMWNFGIPYVLKHYIDVIFQPGALFQYTEKGPQGLIEGKKMIVVTSRGGDYREGLPTHPFDLQEPYLRTAFGFIGISDVQFIHAQPMDAGGPEAGAKVLEETVHEIRHTVKLCPAGETCSA